MTRSRLGHIAHYFVADAHSALVLSDAYGIILLLLPISRSLLGVGMHKYLILNVLVWQARY